MAMIKQVVQLFNLDKYATAKFRVDEPSGKVTYYESVQDALTVGGAIVGSKTYLEVTLAIGKE